MDEDTSNIFVRRCVRGMRLRWLQSGCKVTSMLYVIIQACAREYSQPKIGRKIQKLSLGGETNTVEKKSVVSC